MHLDDLIKAALDRSAASQPLREEDRDALSHLVTLARSFVRFDHEERTRIIEFVRIRAEQQLPPTSDTFFVD
ncbi:hypothetical protein [Salinarimonas ramus]|uniref:hypothetical protein n=1 Tax=Salinarimonas ramus TaxID=690164 RepID=UPI0016629BB3|nr:hypothetical protein [Salinarimonas ramus]